MKGGILTGSAAPSCTSEKDREVREFRQPVESNPTRRKHANGKNFVSCPDSVPCASKVIVALRRCLCESPFCRSLATTSVVSSVRSECEPAWPRHSAGPAHGRSRTSPFSNSITCRQRSERERSSSWASGAGTNVNSTAPDTDRIAGVVATQSRRQADIGTRLQFAQLNRFPVVGGHGDPGGA